MQSTDTPTGDRHDDADKTSVDASVLSDFWRAMALLSRVPLPPVGDFRAALIARSVWCWPFVGLVLAGLALLPAMLVDFLTGNPLVYAIFAIAAMVLLSGAMHEDGVADCADGFGGGMDRDRKLEIMRDSTVGTYAVVMLILTLGLRLVLITAAADIGQAGILFLIMAVISRAAMPIVMRILPPARDNGLGKGAGRPGWLPVLIGFAIASAIVLVLGGIGAMFAVIVGVMIAILIVAMVARSQIGGQTGDVLGATQICAELFAGIGFIAVMA
ncbi:adenosylcobinamide-GDP ribazoletransferase [Thalassospira povalilytica]|uniref:adenosylcobinamide-GDP ribazoletransferase n=1 Tax=Thalassospira povalilytica TaxID=732237 RepID=UPI001D1882B9|nr:adenosylcobinamide-GDP ribazoletransferase [Thalassospira povalilytica]MCC4240067.1 adenosylcobinamide-GDP ribazoletransferase [Thalassospira povalilytica]